MHVYIKQKSQYMGDKELNIKERVFSNQKHNTKTRNQRKPTLLLLRLPLGWHV